MTLTINTNSHMDIPNSPTNYYRGKYKTPNPHNRVKYRTPFKYSLSCMSSLQETVHPTPTKQIKNNNTLRRAFQRRNKRKMEIEAYKETIQLNLHHVNSAVLLILVSLPMQTQPYSIISIQH
jgi:hypothetical protein